MGLFSCSGPSARQQKPNKKQGTLRDGWGWGERKGPDPYGTGKGMGTEDGEREPEWLFRLPSPAEELGAMFFKPRELQAEGGRWRGVKWGEGWRRSSLELSGPWAASSCKLS